LINQFQLVSQSLNQKVTQLNGQLVQLHRKSGTNPVIVFVHEK